MKEGKIQAYSKTPGYVMVFGVLSLILVIIGFIVPIIGAGIIVPIALVFSTASLYNSNNGLSIATTIISVVKLFISPTFWIQISGSEISAFAWISIVCFILSLLFIFKNSRK